MKDIDFLVSCLQDNKVKRYFGYDRDIWIDCKRHSKYIQLLDDSIYQLVHWCSNYSDSVGVFKIVRGAKNQEIISVLKGNPLFDIILKYIER